MAMPDSELRVYIGISATTIKNGQNQYLEAFVPEFLPDDKGCYEKIEHFKVCVKDPFTGAQKCATMNRTKVISAAYWGKTNCSVPCVYKGERVLIYNISGTEQYYWDAMGRDPGLRLRERARWWVMAQPTSVKPDGTYENVKDCNSYFMEFNSNPGEKWMHIHTSIRDGEKHTYDFYIWPEKAILEIYDDIENYIRLWSDEHKWKWNNTDGSYIELDKENINIWCKDTITMTAGKNIHAEATANEVTWKAGQKYVRQAPQQVITGQTRHASFTTDEQVVVGKETLIVSGTYSLSAQTCNYNGKHMFTGENFTVATGSGVVPVIILLGSNAW